MICDIVKLFWLACKVNFRYGSLLCSTLFYWWQWKLSSMQQCLSQVDVMIDSPKGRVIFIIGGT
jgi:hypothetical protein